MSENLNELPAGITNFKFPMEQEKFKDQELAEAKQTAWEAENGEIQNLYSEGAQKYFSTEFPDLKNAFVKEMDTVVCIDEGCAHKDISGEGKLSIAGGGILLPAQSEEERLEIAAKFFTELGIKNITSHEGCGAAKMAYVRDNPGTSPSPGQVDQYAKMWAEKLAAKMAAVAYNIPLAEMERPAEFHTARTAYFDGVGGFNPNKEVGLPQGFVISKRYIPGDYALDELKVAVGIAFGNHGFGELFTSENPFVIIPLAKSIEELNNLKSEIEQALQDNPNREKIKIDGVVV
jgi:hypothetical protein